MHVPFRTICFATLALMFLNGCGSGAASGDSSAPTSAPPPATATTVVTAYYDDDQSRKLAEGEVDALGRAQSQWTWWFADGSVHWQATFVDDVFDPNQDWAEFNADGSLRYTVSDGDAVNLPPDPTP